MGCPAKTSIPLRITGVAEACSLVVLVFAVAAVVADVVVSGDLLLFGGEVLLLCFELLLGLRLMTLDGVLLFLSEDPDS